MKQPGTARDYGRRVEKIVAHIAGHPDEALDFDTLAAVAFFSQAHFHRIYRYVTGETATDTLRRLHRAAGEFMQGAEKNARRGRSGAGTSWRGCAMDGLRSIHLGVRGAKRAQPSPSTAPA